MFRTHNIDRISPFFPLQILVVCVFLLLFFLPHPARGAAETFAWATALGGSGEDLSNDIFIDKSGFVYITGEFEGAVDFDPGTGFSSMTSVGGKDIFVSKFDAQGHFIWASNLYSLIPALQINGIFDDGGTAISVDDSGNVFVTGYYTPDSVWNPILGEYVVPSSPGPTNIFVCKLRGSDGAFVSREIFGDVGADEGQDITTDDKGFVFITGFFEGSVNFSTSVGVSHRLISESSSLDIFILKLDNSLNYIWAQGFGGTSTDFGEGIAVDNAGNVYTTGCFENTIDFDPGIGLELITSSGGRDGLVTKFNSGGNFEWAVTLGGTTMDCGLDIALDSKGNVVTTGYFTGTGDFYPGFGWDTHTSNGGTDVFISKLNKQGAFVWAKSFGGISDDRGVALVTDPQDSIYVMGKFAGEVNFNTDGGTENLASKNAWDVFISKHSATGKFLMAKNMGVFNNIYGGSLALGPKTELYLTSNFEGSVDFDRGPGEALLTSNGLKDIFIKKFNRMTFMPFLYLLLQ